MIRKELSGLIRVATLFGLSIAFGQSLPIGAAPAAPAAPAASAASSAPRDATSRLFLPALLSAGEFAPAEPAAPPTALPSPTLVGALPTAVEPTAAAPTTAPTAVAPTAAPQTAQPTAPATPTATATSLKPNDPAVGVCPAAHFLAVEADPKNAKYPAPTLKVSCSEQLMVVESNGIPSFEFKKTTPNDLQAQTYRWELPLTPTLAASDSAIPLLGPVAIVVDGLPIYGPNEAAPTYGDPFLDRILDFCDGHTAQRGDYHYHRRPVCLFDGQAATPAAALVGTIVGYAFDGYPILSPVVCADADCVETRRLRSSWQRTRDVADAWQAHEFVAGSGDLDKCNGRFDAKGAYHYYATDSFPYFLGCFKGVARQQQRPGGNGGRPPRPLADNDFADPAWLYACHVSPGKAATSVNVPE